MTDIQDIKLSVILDDTAYILNFTMRSWLEYEKITGRGVSFDLSQIYLGKTEEMIAFLRVSLRYTDKFYADTEEEKILSEQDFNKLIQTERAKMKLLISLSQSVRIILYENFLKDDDPKIKKKKKQTQITK